MNNNPIKLKLSELPYEITQKPNPMDPVYFLLRGFGLVMIAIGVYYIIFGPESLMIHVSGPTFGEFLQLYPGPIATVGFLLLSIPDLIKNAQLKNKLKSLEESYVLDTDGQDQMEYKLTFQPIGGNLIVIDAIPTSSEVQNKQMSNP